MFKVTPVYGMLKTGPPSLLYAQTYQSMHHTFTALVTPALPHESSKKSGRMELLVYRDLWKTL